MQNGSGAILHASFVKPEETRRATRFVPKFKSYEVHSSGTIHAVETGNGQTVGGRVSHIIVSCSWAGYADSSLVELPMVGTKQQCPEQQPLLHPVRKQAL